MRKSGGQRGDRGILTFGEEVIPVIDTQKENDLTIHIVKKFPSDFDTVVTAQVHKERRQATSNNHSAVHLMHAALHEVIGEHALQKGQDVDNERLRFDFSHFQKMEEEELQKVEDIVNAKIRENIQLDERRTVPIEEAKEMGATMLFGEKYGEHVRVITFDENFSRELCGGTHVPATGEIGLFKITAESAVAAGIRRIEAVTAGRAESHVNRQLEELKEVRTLLKNPKSTVKSIQSLQEENKSLKKELEKLLAAQAASMKKQLIEQAVQKDGFQLIAATLPINDGNAIKNLAYQIEKEVENAVIVFGAAVKEKPLLTVVINKGLVESKGLNAGSIVRELAKEIKGGGGGQAFFATAGGKDVSGLKNAIEKANEIIA